METGELERGHNNPEPPPLKKVALLSLTGFVTVFWLLGIVIPALTVATSLGILKSGDQPPPSPLMVIVLAAVALGFGYLFYWLSRRMARPYWSAPSGKPGPDN